MSLGLRLWLRLVKQLGLTLPKTIVLTINFSRHKLNKRPVLGTMVEKTLRDPDIDVCAFAGKIDLR